MHSNTLAVHVTYQATFNEYIVCTEWEYLRICTRSGLTT